MSQMSKRRAQKAQDKKASKANKFPTAAPADFAGTRDKEVIVNPEGVVVRTNEQGTEGVLLPPEHLVGGGTALETFNVQPNTELKEEPMSPKTDLTAKATIKERLASAIGFMKKPVTDTLPGSVSAKLPGFAKKVPTGGAMMAAILLVGGIVYGARKLRKR